MSDEEVPARGAIAERRDPLAALRRWVTTGQFGLSSRAWLVLLAVTAASLAVRLYALGWRTMHFDEGRVAYWALRYAETGHFQYRYIIHGPLLQHVGRLLFPLAGATDFAARLPVALVGGFFPLVGLLFRDHLRDEEVVALGLLLAGTPVVVYYSRFMRSDVLVAAFMLACLGFLVRLLATRRRRYLYLAVAAFALGFASKENALVYLIAWAGAGVLLLDTALFRPRGEHAGVRARRWVAERRATDSLRPLARRVGVVGLKAGLLLAALLLVLFAPRGGPAGDVGLYRTLTAPWRFPALVEETAWDIAYGLGYWFGGAAEPRCFEETVYAGYACFLGRYLTTMWKFAATVSVLSVAGFLLERWSPGRSRRLVLFASYWGAASVVGYPLGMDIWAAWPLTHALVALAVPAAVALGWCWRRALAARAGRHRVAGVVVAVVALLLVANMAATAATASFGEPMARDSETSMVQFAQPSDDMKPGLAAMAAAVAGNDGVDVLYVGDRYHLYDEAIVAAPPPTATADGETNDAWFNRLPLPWYTQAMGASVDSVGGVDALDAMLADASPPVLVVEGSMADAVGERLDGYDRYAYSLRAHVGGPGRYTNVVIFVSENR